MGARRPQAASSFSFTLTVHRGPNLAIDGLSCPIVRRYVDALPRPMLVAGCDAVLFLCGLSVYPPSLPCSVFSNGIAVRAKSVESACSGSSTSDGCTWRQWWVEPESSDAVKYYAFAEADHPVDVAPGTLWYT